MSAEDIRLAYDGLADVRSAPKLITEVPGPEAHGVDRARRARSRRPSLPRAYPFVPKRGAGSIVEDVDGNIFLDLNAGIAVTSTGHCHPQRGRGDPAAGGRAAALLGERLLPAGLLPRCASGSTQLAPFGDRPARSFLTNSGTEAVEAAIKLARFATGRQYLIGFYQSFHGRSMGSASRSRRRRRSTAPTSDRCCPACYHAFYGDFDYLDEVVFKRLVSPTEVAAIVVESWLGEGGYVLPPDGWFTYLRELCDRHGILLVCDEVQSGMGRSGKMWAIEHEGVDPDILISGKGIASGLPLGAMIAREDRDGLGPRVARVYVRRQSALVRGRARDVRRDTGRGSARERGPRGLRLDRRTPPDEDATSPDPGGQGRGDVDRARVRRSRGGRGGRARAFRRGLLMLSCGDDAIRVSPPLVFREDQAREALRSSEEVVAEVEAET